MQVLKRMSFGAVNPKLILGQIRHGQVIHGQDEGALYEALAARGRKHGISGHLDDRER